MSANKVNQLIAQMENHLECWKQFNYYLNLARSKKFTAEDEQQFLEIKSILAQELELILAGVECTSPSRDDIHSLISNAPSIRYLSELNEATLRQLENHWHKIYIGWQSLLGQLKVQQQKEEPRSFWASLFGRTNSSSSS